MRETRPMPPAASVAHKGTGERLHAPAAERNAQAIARVLQDYAPQKGTALEIASGTGQHVAAFAELLPGLTWQPSDIAADRLASINSWAEDKPGILPAIRLDATRPGWSRDHGGKAVILLVNLLHLISTAEARTVVCEAAAALAPSGRFFLYGPFLRDGQAISDGDARFDAALRSSDPAIGYKDIVEVRQWLADAGLTEVALLDMPANNLTMISARPEETFE